MNILLLLVPISVILLGIAIAAFAWAVRSGQFDDLDAAPLDILIDVSGRTGRSEAQVQDADD